ncbi:MAG: Pls/PosA family non-ribosomal peptide synthetase, partial [Verrucomicrobiota bacterium]
LSSRLLLKGIKEGNYPLWGKVYFRWWLVQTIQKTSVLEQLNGTPLYPLYLRFLGMNIGRNVKLESIQYGLPQLISIDSNVCVGSDVLLQNTWVENGFFKVRKIVLGRDSIVGSRCVLSGGSEMEDRTELKDMGYLRDGQRIPSNEIWEGSPAKKVADRDANEVDLHPEASLGTKWAFGGMFVILLALFPLFMVVPMIPTLIAITTLDEAAPDYSFWYLLYYPGFAFSYVVLFLIQSILLIRLVQNQIKPGIYPLYSVTYLRKWFADHIWRLALFVLHPIYATVFISPVLRLLGAKIGKNSEISTASNVTPHLLEIGEEAFVADTVSLGEMEVRGNSIILEATLIGKSSFIGNAARVPQGSEIPPNVLIGVMSTPPTKEQFVQSSAKNWFGIPAIPMPRRQESRAFDETLKLHPSWRRRFARGLVEFFRIILPMRVVISLSTIFVAFAHDLMTEESLFDVIIQMPFYYLGIIGIPAFLIAVALKWVLVGKYRETEVPMWSWRVWSSEAVTVIYESLAVPYFLQFLQGTPLLPVVLKLFGVHVGDRVWMNTTDITEFDLVTLESDVALNEDSGPQTHLFEDRVMKMGFVHIGEKSSIGARTVVLYGSTIGRHVFVEPQSLVMKGETLLEETSWSGSPVSPV